MPRTKTKPKPSKPAPVPARPLPAACECYLTIADICTALRIGRDVFRMLRREGQYPEPDAELGGGPRWRVTTHNRWINNAGSVPPQE